MSTLTIERQRTDIGATIYNMRQSGATLQQIANRIDRTKERVRQILVKNYGSTKHNLISTEQLCEILGLSKNRIVELYQSSVISPAREWNTDGGHYLLWSPASVEQINIYYKTHRSCKICHCPITKGRLVYCSEQCCREGHKYKYKSIEAKQRHLRNIKRYRDKKKWLAQSW